MLLRAIAIVVSVLLHAWTGNAMWALLEKDKLEAFDLGDGLDVVLEPPALIASEVTAVGDSLSPSNQSQSAAAAVSAPPPAPLREKASDALASNTRPPPPQEAATATAQEHSAQLPVAAAPELLPDVIDSSESKTTAQVAVLGEHKPPPPRAPALPPDELGDVITSRHSAIDDAVPEAREPAPAELGGQDAAAPGLAVEPQALEPREVRPQEVSQPDPVTAQGVAAPETFNERRLAHAARPVRPNEITEPAPVESINRPVPEELKDQRASPIAQPKTPDAAREPAPPPALKSPEPNLLQEPGLAMTREPRPPAPLPEQMPETIEVIAEPQQIVVVRELSAGEEKQGGDATQVGLYLGRINQQVQRAKVNPRSAMTGTTILKFTVGLDGKLVSKEVAESSGFPVLDDAALTTLDRASPFPAIPPDVSRTPMTFQQPFKFVVR